MFGELVNEFLDALTLARWQFGLTTLYHFLFVPLTIGLSFLVAILQTAWVRTGKPESTDVAAGALIFSTAGQRHHSGRLESQAPGVPFVH